MSIPCSLPKFHLSWDHVVVAFPSALLRIQIVFVCFCLRAGLGLATPLSVYVSKQTQELITVLSWIMLARDRSCFLEDLSLSIVVSTLLAMDYAKISTAASVKSFAYSGDGLQVGVLADSTCFQIAEKECGGNRFGVFDMNRSGVDMRFWISNCGVCKWQANHCFPAAWKQLLGL